MQDKTTKVLYIAGFGRSGSTILSNILGEVEGFFSVGELNYMWERSLKESWLCGCGLPMTECEVWSPILNKAFGTLDQIAPPEGIYLRQGRKGTRMRHLPLMLAPGGERLLRFRLGNYFDSIEELYHAIQDVTGCRVVVDSSKSPAYGYVLGMVPTIDLYVVHLVRDSRAASYSFLRKKREPSKKGTVYYMQQYGFVASSLLWNFWNWATQALLQRSPDRYLRLRYEDFIDDPQKSLRRIFELVQEEPAHLPFLTDNKVELGVNHTASGNPNRFQTGVVELRPDDEWRAKIKPLGKNVVTLLTWPLLRRYGYRT